MGCSSKGLTLTDGPEGFLAGISRKPSHRNGSAGEHVLSVHRGEELWGILTPDQGGHCEGWGPIKYQPPRLEG